MSHGLTRNDRMFSVRFAPWHYSETGDLVTIPDYYPGREEAMRLAGHDFTVSEQPVYRLRSFGLREPVNGWKLLVDDSTDELLTVARDSYTVVQNSVCWDIVDALVEQPNVKYKTAGTLNDKSKLWVLAELDEPYEVTGAETVVMPYVVVQWSHDGSSAVRAMSTNVVVVCQNTARAAELDARRANTDFTFRHTRSVMDKIEDAKAALKGVRADNAAFRALAEQLAATPVSDRGIRKFVHEFIPEPVGDVISDRVRENIDLARGMVLSLFDGDTIAPGIRNTGYGLLMAGTEYLDHLRGFRNHNTYLGRTLLRTEPLKQRLVPLITRIAEEESVA